MHLVLLIGIQATGKSTFCREHFYRSHVRINLDMLRTRHREKLLVDACIAGGAPFVVDNTNLTKADRARYIKPARDAGYRIDGYFFQSRVAEAKERNASRHIGRVPQAAISGASGKLELPRLDEGFGGLYFVRIAAAGEFITEEWKPD